jgi:hypothetical protein
MAIQNNGSIPVQLPTNPVDGQIWIDGNLVRWRWSAEYDVWVNIGSATTYPQADINTTGLMSPQDKRFLDSIPVIAGAFGIITDQSAIIRSQDNRVGLVSGAVQLYSDSLSIECIDASGAPYLGQPLPDDPTGVNLAGLKFSLNTTFLDTLCLEVVGPTGKKGEKGPDGLPGKDGFNDGPAGEKGDPGIDATVAHTFSGIKVVDVSDIVDEAVVALQMDGASGRLSYTTAKMNVPSNTAPADQLAAQPIQRALIYPTVAEDGKDYVTLNDWRLSIPPGDPLENADTPDVLLVKMSPDLEVGQALPIELTKLTDLISVVVDSYKAKLETFQDTWMAQMKSYIESKDSAARTVLSSIAQQVAQCEFKRPLEFCCTPGTKITVDNGLTNVIELVAVGDYVMCDDGEIHNVMKTMVRDVDEELCIIYPSGTGSPLTLTQDHPVLVAKFDNCRKRGRGRRVYKNDLAFADFAMIPASEVKQKDLLFIPKPSGKLDFELGEELSEFLGWYGAEGDARRYTVRFSLGPDEDAEAKRIIELGISLGATSCVRKQGVRSIIVSVYGKHLHDICLQHVGHGARHKKLSPQMMRLCPRDFTAFTKAFMLGDGFAGFTGTGYRIESTLASVNLIEQLFWLFAKHGYTSTRWFGLGPGGPKYRDRKRLRGHLNLSQSQAHKFLPDIIPAQSKPIPCSLFEIDGGFASRVRKVDRIHYKGPVYNLEVADRNTYLANGVVVHNCLGIAPSDCSQGTANTLLTSDITVVDTVIGVDSYSGFPTTGPYTIIVGTEHMLVTGGYGTTIWTVTRGTDGTTPVAHSASTAIVLKIEVVIPIVEAGDSPQPAPDASGTTTLATTSSDDTTTDATEQMRTKYSTSAPFDPTNPAKCLLPYRMMQIIITDEANPVYVTGIPDANLTIVNYYNNDKAAWEKFVGSLTANQIVALGLLQIPNTDSAYYGDERDMKCASCTFPYDSMRDETFYHLLPVQDPKITSDDIVTFVERMLTRIEYDYDNQIKLCGSDFEPNQINILFKSKALSGIATSALDEQSALNDAIAELESRHPSICFVSSISSSSPDHNQDDRWLMDATATASRYMCYQCPTATVPGNDHVVIMCIADESSPIYNYSGYKGPDGVSGPVGIPQGMTAWDYDIAKWKDSLAVLRGSDNKVRLGILQPQGYAGASPRGGALKPSNAAWPGDTDRSKITIAQTNTPSFTSNDMLSTFKAIIDNGQYAPTILYIVVDTSGSLGNPDDVDSIVSAGVDLIQRTYPTLHIMTDIVDIGANKVGELAIPPAIDGYVTQAASSQYLWGWEYVSPAKQTILFPTLYVRSTIDAAERWLGRAVGIVEQLLYYWMPRTTYIPTAAYQMLVLVITDESNCSPTRTTNDGYHSYEGSGFNTGYDNYKRDKSQWNTWLSSLCPGQYTTVGILQLANPGPSAYPEQTDRGPDQYTLADGSKTNGWVVDEAHPFTQDVRDILPDTSWGTNLDLSVEDGSLPRDSKGTITHKILPWRGFGIQRVTATDIIEFYNEITNYGSSCPDVVAVLLDTTESMKPYLRYWINTVVTEHNNTTHGVNVNQASPLSYYDETLGRWIGPRTSGSVDTIETDVGFTMNTEITSAVLALQCIVPAAGYTTYGYKHPLVTEMSFDGRWLEAINTATTLFLNKENDTTFHVGDETWWSNYRSGMCQQVVGATIPCSDCGSP